MFWRVFAGFAALCAMAACASSPAPIVRHYPPAPYNQAQGGEIYASAPFAPLHGELFVCNNGAGSNLGEIGARGEALRYTPYMHTPAGALLRNPTEAACLSSGFGWRNSMGGAGREHVGLDLANRGGGFIYAAADGWVTHAGWRGAYGNVVELDHGHGVRTLYAHLAEIDPRLAPGMFVPARAPMARMGATGNATGVHLHYEVMVHGLRVDPLRYGADDEAPVS